MGLPAVIGTRRALLGVPRRYSDKVLSIQRSSLIAYWPLSESSGTTITDLSGNSRNGTYTGVDLGQTGIGDGRTAPLWDGVNDRGNVYSASLAGAFNGDEGSVQFWLKASNSSVWSDGVTRELLLWQADSSNQIRVVKPVSANTLLVRRSGAGTPKTTTVTVSATTWQHLVLTWSKSADQQIAYLNGVQQGLPLTGLGAWAGSLSSTATALGSSSGVSSATVWNGYLAHVAAWSTPLSAAEIARLAVVP